MPWATESSVVRKTTADKYHNDQPDNADDKCIRIYATSLMTPGYTNSLTIAVYRRVVEKNNERLYAICFDG